MMEKVGIEVEGSDDGEKTAGVKCSHPEGSLRRDGDAVFCMRCEKYLNV